ncbi:hypothetical protein PRUPE_1G271200 [Prunus persica]|uniref:Uncharacterized protein n=1 Tax=Prunus persica TaxID=3760 RepID=A0A251R3X3_PRUPE|nr:hypothetical protein PRUPE_1G271200 [Prunus persica]
MIRLHAWSWDISTYLFSSLNLFKVSKGRMCVLLLQQISFCIGFHKRE